MDITELKRTEAALRESEATASDRAEELKTFMETVPAAVWIAHDPQCQWHGRLGTGVSSDTRPRPRNLY